MNLESELKDVLRRADPPDGFADRVMRNVETGFGPSRSRLKPAATLAAGILIAATLGGLGIHARNELLTAMRIASQKVAHAQQQVNRR